MRENTLNTPKARAIKARRKRQRIEAVLAMLLFIAIAVFILAGISLANGNVKALIYMGVSMAACVPAIIYLNKEEAK